MGLIAGHSSPFTDSTRKILHRILLRWYARHGRTLPWRDVDNPYYVMVSEFMLQQTQVARVLEHFPRWIGRFPSVADLAAARKRDVLVAWSGMGYNRRALYLHEAARTVVRVHDGQLPEDPEVLRALPGFGRYTAHAVACFGHRKRLPIVDVNIRRVLSRLTRNMEHVSAMLPEPAVWDIAAELLPPRAHYNWNQALMDLGATICTARSPACDACPLRSHCPSAGVLAPPPAGERSAGKRTTRGRSAAHLHAADTAASGTETLREPAGDSAGRSSAGTRPVPRRIYRGRAIEHLRQIRGHCSDARRLCLLLLGACERDDRAQLLDILASLQQDGMIRATVRRKAVRDIRAFSEPLERLRICLTI